MVFPNARRRDAHNTWPSIKACVDGAIDARIAADDRDSCLLAVTVTGLVRVKARPLLLMTWTPADPHAPAGVPRIAADGLGPREATLGGPPHAQAHSAAPSPTAHHPNPTPGGTPMPTTTLAAS